MMGVIVGVVISVAAFLLLLAIIVPLLVVAFEDTQIFEAIDERIAGWIRKKRGGK